MEQEKNAMDKKTLQNLQATLGCDDDPDSDEDQMMQPEENGKPEGIDNGGKKMEESKEA